MPNRRDVDILHALFMELARIRYGDTSKWAKVSNYQKVKTYFSAGPESVGAFANTLNAVNPMHKDHILIHPKNIKSAKTVGNIYGALLAAYKGSNWGIIP